MKKGKSITLFPDYYNLDNNRIYLFSAYDKYLKSSTKIIIPTKHFSFKYYKKISLNEFFFVFIFFCEAFLKKVKINISFIKYYFKLMKISEIIVTCSYNKITGHILDLAKKNGIKTIEIQHGHLRKDHDVYKLGIPNVDEYWCWKEDYAKLIKSFEPKIKIKIVGFPFSESKEDTKIKDINSLLIIDQWTIRSEIVDFTKKVRAYNPRVNITYKLHPNKSYWPKKELFPKSDNIVIMKSKDRVIDICNNFDAVLGAYSTGLIEARLNGILAFLIDGYNDEILLENEFVKPYQDLYEYLK